MDLPHRKIYSVSELNEQIGVLLETSFPSVWVRGEISNFRAAPSGHMYFTLKDNSAQIRCVMFRIQSRFIRFRLEDGLNIIAWGKLSVYTLRGEYQLIVDTVEAAGLGNLMLAFEQLKARLAQEGLFEPGRKRPIPALPKKIGIVTSATGAAIRDMVNVIKRRFKGVHIVVSPATVQGDRAPKEIEAAIGRLCQLGDIDVIIVGRGGGSIEDLWAFNDEMVVRTVAACPLPVVSAVGHETDVTLTDFAADLRAPTPSAAAELIVPDQRDLEAIIEHLTARLRNGVSACLRKDREAVNGLSKRLYDPRRIIKDKTQRIDELTSRLERGMQRRLKETRSEIAGLESRMRPERFKERLETLKSECGRLVERLRKSTLVDLAGRVSRLEHTAAHLNALSPLKVLERGYSITLKSNNRKVVTDAATVELGENLTIRLHKGELLCSVFEKIDKV
jgi:exodeoxyribonuclease VII large subunit